MCFPAIAAAVPALGGAAGIGSALAAVGTVTSIYGQLQQGRAMARSAQQQADFLEQQRQDELKLSAIEDDRIREKFRAELGRQRAELVARGISLDSPTAVHFGEAAAREASFASQSRRSESGARAAELSATERQMRARGRMSLLRGRLSAASTFLDRAPDVWPGLLEGGAG